MTATTIAPSARAMRPALVLLVACVAQFMLLADDTIVNVALPSIASDLGFGESSLSWVVNAYLLTFGGFLLIGGRLADRFGPRRLFMWSLAGFALASAISGIAPSSGVLVVARGLQGIMGALMSPAALAIVLATYPDGAGRRRALSAWAAMLGLGAAFGLVAGGALVELAGWRWIFLVNLPVAALALAAATQVLPAGDRRDARDAPNIPGAALATVSLLVLVFTVVETHTAGWTSARTLLGFALAVALAAAFAVAERRVRSPLLPVELLRRRRAMSADAVVFIAAGGLLAMFFFQTLYLQQVLGLTALQTGLAFLPFSAAMGIASGLMGRLPERVDPRLPIVAGIVAAAVGLWMMSRLGVGSAYGADVLPALAIVAAGLGVAFVPLMGLATGDAEERDGGLASGLMTTAQQVGGAIGIAVMITIATTHTTDALAGGARPAQALTKGFAGAFRVEAIVLLVAAALAGALLGARRGEGASVS
ncbi:MAG TPA: MFS transporter [Solirubrobacteraceae bacterium]|jgi:EmrB/QacA subfamily drug resistance transporter|nr:MFS transporter [Solirubrobacteraceae bacterium]